MMKRQRLISKGSLSRLFQDAAEAWRRQDYQETIALLERASRLDPANASVQLDLGRAYGLRYEYEAADRCFEKAAKIAPQRFFRASRLASKNRSKLFPPACFTAGAN